MTIEESASMIANKGRNLASRYLGHAASQVMYEMANEIDRLVLDRADLLSAIKDYKATIIALLDGLDPTNQTHRCTLNGDTCYVCGDYWPCVTYTDSQGI